MKSYLRETLEIALGVGALFDSLKVPWVVAGSVASSIRGEPRSTNDVDLVADLQQEHVSPLVWAFGDLYYFDEEAMRDAIRRRACFNLIHLESMFKVDVFVPRRDPTSLNQLVRRQLVVVGSGDDSLCIPVASVEDMILQKLLWFTSGGAVSDRQWRDILAMIRVAGLTLDREYLKHHADANALAPLLEKAFVEGGVQER